MRLRSSDLTWREIDGDLVILDLRSSQYLTANSSGAILMKELIEDRSQADLVQALVTAFGIPNTQAETDVRDFLGVLEESGLLEKAGSV